MRLLRGVGDPRGLGQEAFGYTQFGALWKQRECPDGLVVALDTTARGVLLAVVEKQVQVPQNLKLVLHKNAGVELLCPVPATLVVWDEHEVARALIEQVQKQFRGERIEPILVGHKVVKTEGLNGKKNRDAV